MLYRTLTIQRIKEEIKDFKTFVFESSQGIDYKAGQYLTFIYKDQQEELRRSYSIISSPVLNEPLAIGVKRMDNGFFSRQLIDRALPGDKLITIGAGGFFTLPANINSCVQLFFFAAGSGITPIYCLLKTALHLHRHLRVVLVYSNPSLQKTIFYSELKQLAEKFTGRFYTEFLFSNLPDLTQARLHKDLLLQLVEKYSVASFSKTLFYICGPESYMRMCTYALQEEKVPKENIKRENFIVELKAILQPAPPDKETHTAFIRYGGYEYKLAVPYPLSILQAAKKQGIELPYSCETGKCGSCAAKCISGKIWLSYNEVLTEKDIKEGLTLTCVGHPNNSDVTIEI